MMTILSLFGILILSGCGTKEENQVQNVLTGGIEQETFVVGKEAFLQDSVYGSVIADNVNNIFSSVGGRIENINCQPGNFVNKGDLIAKIVPIQEDINFKNSQVQEKTLKNQLSNLFDTYNSTSENFEIQVETLRKQKENNQKQLEILNQNLYNLMRQKSLTSGDISIQTQTLEQQLESLKIDKEKNLGKIESNLENLKKQVIISLADAFKKTDEVFGITQANKIKNDAYEIYLSAKDIALKNQVETRFYELYREFPNLSEKSESEISQYIWDVAGLMKLCADSVNNSISTTNFPQSSASPITPSIDGFYASFNGFSNSLLSIKTNFDNVSLSYDSAVNTYDNQINTMTLNLQNLKVNKIDMTNISLDTQINNLISQVNNLELAVRMSDDQLNSLFNNKTIQLNTLSSQTFSLQQNYDTVKNTINGENIYAGVDGIIKTKHVAKGNKIAPNTLVCQIFPDEVNNLKIQLFSSIQMDLGTELEFYDKDKYLGIAKLEYELPFKDIVTQNYVYEIVNFDFPVKDGDRLTIKFNKNLNADELWIPLEFVAPRLDGNYVKLKKGLEIIELKIQIADINRGYVKVLNGLVRGNVIVK